MRHLALIGLLALTACDVRGRVLMVGDSNMSMTADTYAAYLYGGLGGALVDPAPAYLLTFAAVPGAGFKDSAYWAPSLESVDAAQTFDAVVINLGVNDGVGGNCTASLAARIDAVYGALPADIPIIVVDAPYVPNSAYSTTCLVGVNTELQAAHYRWSPRTTYINVNTALSGIAPNQRYLADNVHFSPASKLAVAEAVRQALEAAL